MTIVVDKALSRDDVHEVVTKSQKAFHKVTAPSDEPQGGARSPKTKRITISNPKESQPISHPKNLQGSSSDANKKGGKSKLPAKARAVESLSKKATLSKPPSCPAPQAFVKELSRQSRPRSTSRHRKNKGPHQAEKQTSKDQNRTPTQDTHTNTHDLPGEGDQQESITTACQAEDLQYEADVQTLFWEQNLPVELCDQILQLHSEKEARFNAFWKATSADVSKHDVSSRVSRVSTQSRKNGTDVPAEDLKAGKKPIEPAGSSSQDRTRKSASLTRTKPERKETLPTEDSDEDNSTHDVEFIFVEEEEEEEEADAEAEAEREDEERTDDDDYSDNDKEEGTVEATESDHKLVRPFEQTRESAGRRATVEFADEVA